MCNERLLHSSFLVASGSDDVSTNINGRMVQKLTTVRMESCAMKDLHSSFLVASGSDDVSTPIRGIFYSSMWIGSNSGVVNLDWT